jgi:hypothetical protein
MTTFAHDRLTRSLARTAVLASLSVLVSFAAVAKDNGSGPTTEQIYCQNRAVNDYWDNVKACEQNLSDIPDQLALCKSDAYDDLKRAKAACLAQARTSVFGGVVLAPSNPVRLTR